jgi:hypothetical protein
MQVLAPSVRSILTQQVPACNIVSSRLARLNLRVLATDKGLDRASRPQFATVSTAISNFAPKCGSVYMLPQVCFNVDLPGARRGLPDPRPLESQCNSGALRSAETSDLTVPQGVAHRTSSLLRHYTSTAAHAALPRPDTTLVTSIKNQSTAPMTTTRLPA